MNVLAIDASDRRSARYWGRGGSAFACAVAMGAVGHIFLGCRDCSAAVRPIPSALLQMQLALCGLTALVYATAGDSARRRSLAIGLNAFAFAGLLVATAHGIVAQEGFCPSCFVTWAGLGLALLLQSGAAPVVRWWLPAILAGSLALRAASKGTEGSALLLQDTLRSGLTRTGFNYRLPHTALRAGDAIPNLNRVDGVTVFLTQCSPCTRKALEGFLQTRGLLPSSMTFVVADGSEEWQIPTGFEATRRIEDANAWKAAGILPFGPPCLVRLEKGTVKEVLF